MSEMLFTAAIARTIAEEMRRDPDVFVMGEDVGVIGGIYGASKGLLEEFGRERIRQTPISEAGFVGAGLGAACTGMRPIVELMYMDFTFVCMDQILNQIAKTRYVFGGKAKIPLVIRGQQGVGGGNAATHSQSVESLFLNFPGLKIVVPSTAADAVGLLRTAIRDDNPVLFFEHKKLYKGGKWEVPDDPEYMIPFGVADIKRKGTDVTIVATQFYVGEALKAAEELAKEGISAEVVDPRTLYPLDIDTICESVKKTGHLVTVHEACAIGGWGSEIESQVMDHVFRYMDAAPVRVGAKHCPLPFNPNLEKAVVPQVADIVAACKKTLSR